MLVYFTEFLSSVIVTVCDKLFSKTERKLGNYVRAFVLIHAHYVIIYHDCNFEITEKANFHFYIRIFIVISTMNL